MSQPPARRPPPPGRGGAPGTNPRPNPTPDTNQHPRGAPPGRGGPARGNRGGGRSLPQKPTTAPPQKRVNMPKPNNTPSGIPDGATRGAPRAGPGPGRPNKPAPPPRPPGETNVPDVHSQKPVITPQVNVNLGAVARSRAPSVTPVPGGPPRASVVNATPPAVIAAAPPKDIPPEGSPEAIASQKRLNIVKEIVSTEQTYNTALDIMVNHYQKPITAAAETVLLPETLKEDVSAVFSNASHILPISKTLLETVRQFADNWTPDMQLGPTFLKMAPFFRIYNKYQNNYERAVETLTKCQKDEIFNQFVDAIDAVVKAEVKDEKATVKLESLIIMPVQRIPRIILLLGELQRKTPDTHPDKDILGQAIEALDEVMNYLDKDITSEEFREKFLAMGSKFKGASELIKAHRVLVDEATITLKDTKEPATGLKSKLIQQQKLRIWLFNDVLVHLKTNKSKKKTNVASTEHTWPLQLVWLKDEPDDAVIDPKMPYSFMLVGPRKSYFLKFAEQNEKKAWYDKIQKQITANLTDENSDESDPMKRFCYYKFPGKHNAEYEGWWHFGKLHGQGSFKIMSNVYKGDFESDRKSGTGTFSSVTGEVYHGEWKEDRPNGYGQLMYTNKDRYEGLWKDGLRHGKGIHYYSNGDCYDGEWSQDIQSGSGKYTTTTGFLYTGSWLAGKVHGEGVLIAPNGRRYDGEFKSGLKCGEGFMDYNNGECYVGQWNMDKPNGFGIFTSVVDGTYVGTFVNGMKEGTGRQTYLNGDYYEGGFKKNLFHDRGSLVISSGGLERYDGKWENGKFCGKGICTIRGLGKLEGEFKDDKPHGAGTFSSKGGTFFDGKWIDGRRDGKATICTRDDKFACTCTKGMMGKREASFLVIPDIPTFHLEL